MRYQPINRTTLPSNTRAVSVAQRTLANVLPHAARRIDNAYRVEGFPVLVYTRMNSGPACRCKITPSVLRPDGTADPAMLNQFLTGGQEFGVIAYGTKVADQHRNANYETPQSPEVNHGADGAPFDDGTYPRSSNTRSNTVVNNTGLREHPRNKNSLTAALGTQHRQVASGNLPAKYQHDSNTRGSQDIPLVAQGGSPFDIFATSPDVDPHASTIVPDGVGNNGPVGNFRPNSGAATGDPDNFYDAFNLPFGFDSLSITDSGCPVCMGTGFIGGFSPIAARRVVLTSSDPTFTGSADTSTEETIPSTSLAQPIEFSVLFPRFVTGMDALRVWNNRSPVFGQFYVDGVAATQADFASPKYATGTHHTVKFVAAPGQTRFTHMEIQWGVSEAMFCDFPKVSKNGTATLLDSTSEVSLNFGPSLPLIRPFDIIVDSVYGKVWRVDTVTPHMLRSKTVVSWEVTAVVAQPNEFINMLPSRRVRPVGYSTIPMTTTSLKL